MMHPIDSVIIAKINYISQLFKFNFYSSYDNLDMRRGGVVLLEPKIQECHLIQSISYNREP